MMAARTEQDRRRQDLHLRRRRRRSHPHRRARPRGPLGPRGVVPRTALCAHRIGPAGGRGGADALSDDRRGRAGTFPGGFVALGGRWAVLALGGWGGGALLPASDLDILILSDAPTESLKPFVEAVLYPLWDAGLKVGHQVRSPKQQLKAMREDLKTCTAMLTGRPMAGDMGWAEGPCARASPRSQRSRSGSWPRSRADRDRDRPICWSPI